MAAKTKVTLKKGGTGERTIEIGSLEIKDMWHIAAAIRGGVNFSKAPMGDNEILSDGVLEVWGIAHDLKKHIIEKEL